MKVLHISDWHCAPETAERRLRESPLPQRRPDLVIITGDMLPDWPSDLKDVGRVISIEQRERWQRRQWLRMADLFHRTWPGVPKVAVPGNHDLCNYAVPGKVRSFDKYEARTIRVGKLLLAGFRGVPWFCGAWDGEHTERAMDIIVSGMSRRPDIVVTHTPPYGILDSMKNGRQVGCERLARYFVERSFAGQAPQLHCFGHIHEQGGLQVVSRSTIHSNASRTWNEIDL